MKKIILKVALLACAAIAGNVHAVGVSGQGTWETTLLGRDITGKAVASNDASSVFLYDTTLNITWLRDANSNGVMTWDQAIAWANSLNNNAAYGSLTGWRLPTMIDTGTPGCNSANSGTDCGYNVQTKSGNLTQYQVGQTVYSEMASLFYETLGNKAYFSPAGVFQPDYGLSNEGAFQNLQLYYWSGLEYAPDTGSAWYFNTSVGGGGYNAKPNSLYALALRSGEVLAAPIPESETYALMLGGLAVVGVAARRSNAA